MSFRVSISRETQNIKLLTASKRRRKETGMSAGKNYK